MPNVESKSLNLVTLAKVLAIALDPTGSPEEKANAAAKAREMVDGDFSKIASGNAHARQTLDEAYWMDMWNRTSQELRRVNAEHARAKKALREEEAKRKEQSKKRTDLAQHNRVLKAEVVSLKAALDDANARLKPPMTFAEMATALNRELEAQAVAAQAAAWVAMELSIAARERASASKAVAAAFNAPPSKGAEPEREPEPVPDPISEPEPMGTGPTPSPSFVPSKYFEALTDKWQRPNDLAIVLDVTRNTVKKYMNQLVSQGFAEMGQKPWAYRRAPGA